MANQIIGPQIREAASTAGSGANCCALQGSELVERARQHGIKVESHWWHDEYSGSVEALVAAGLATNEQFPGRAGTPKLSATFYRGVLVRKGSKHPMDENYLRIVVRSANRFSVLLGLPPQEVERRRLEADEDAAAREETQHRKRLDQASAEATVEEYRQFTSDMILMTWRSAAENTATSLQPFALETADIERLRGVLCQALAIIKTARVVPLRTRAAALEKAQGDQLFQAFMVGQGLRDLAMNGEQQ